jgi:ribosomal protein S6--L-glutamate ligase
MLQKFIKESEGTDLRVFVVGGEVIASMKRIAKEGDFRSNIHRGALAQTVQPSQECKRMALRATKILGLQVAGVDMLQTGKGPLLLEVNSSPGFQGLEEATSVNVAKKIIQYGVRFAKGLSR